MRKESTACQTPHTFIVFVRLPLLSNFQGRAEMSTRFGSDRVRKLIHVIGIEIFDSGWDHPSKVNAMVSARSSARLFRVASAPWIIRKGLTRGGGVFDVTPPTPELVGFSEKGGQLSFFLLRIRRRSPLVLPKGDFIFTEEEVIRMFDLTFVVTSDMIKSYDVPIDTSRDINDTWRKSRVAQRRDPSTSDDDVATKAGTNKTSPHVLT
ncbi:hypothetical protein BHM03_00042633 [Ensete ventricosum]|nr:hypothetical protein BHM03_00042633 [Ensete ventricosum]